MRRWSFVILAGLAMTGCAEPEMKAPIVVFVDAGLEASFEQSLEEFTAATRVPVEVLVRESRRNLDLLVTNSVFPPADVILSEDAALLHRAAEDGALRPLSQQAVQVSNALLLDPDNFWVAVSVRRIVIVAADESSLPVTYDDLASERMSGMVCLSSSGHPANRSLIAALIKQRGVKPAERVVRGWIRNLALPPRQSEAELREAIQAGTCEYGIVASGAGEKLPRVAPEPVYVTTVAAGVGRHARQPESAHLFVEWLIDSRQADVAADFSQVGVAGWLDEDVRLLADRAAYH